MQPDWAVPTYVGCCAERFGDHVGGHIDKLRKKWESDMPHPDYVIIVGAQWATKAEYEPRLVRRFLRKLVACCVNLQVGRGK